LHRWRPVETKGGEATKAPPFLEGFAAVGLAPLLGRRAGCIAAMSLSTAESAACGALAGIVEISASQPTISLKNALQDGRPLSFRPSDLYRGLGANAASIAPITAVQFGANKLYENLAKSAGADVDSGAVRIGVAALAGATSGVVACPPELLVIQQQKHQKELGAMYREIVEKHGPMSLLRGITPTMVREGIYTASYLGLAPVIRQALRESGHSDTVAFVGSAIASGLTAGTLTHPFDTAKTRMQSNIDGSNPAYRTTFSTLGTLMSEGGVSRLYLGFLPRTFRLCMAVGILNVAKDAISSAYLSMTGRVGDAARQTTPTTAAPAS